MSASTFTRLDAPPKRRTRWPAFLAVALLLGGGALAWERGGVPHRAPQAAPSGPPPVPVTVAAAETRDVPVLATGLGAVQAFNTVTVRARVDGAIERVAFTEGQDVNAGDVLIQVDARPYQAQLAAAQAQRARDEAQLANAQRDLQRYTDLARSEFAARQQVDTQTAQVAQYRAAIAADQAQIDLAATNLSYTTITAPIAGRLGARLVDQGNLVQASAGTPLVVIAQIRPISVTFALPQDALPDVQRAIAASAEPLQVQAFGRDPARPLATGRLVLVNNAVDAATGTVQLKATFDNADLALWPGQAVTARLRLSVRVGAVTVPSAAIQRGPDGAYAYVVGADGKAEMRPVVPAFTEDGTTVLERGVNAGERVVVEGAFKLRPGSRTHVPDAGARS